MSKHKQIAAENCNCFEPHQSRPIVKFVCPSPKKYRGATHDTWVNMKSSSNCLSTTIATICVYHGFPIFLSFKPCHRFIFSLHMIFLCLCFCLFPLHFSFSLLFHAASYFRGWFHLPFVCVFPLFIFLFVRGYTKVVQFHESILINVRIKW